MRRAGVAVLACAAVATGLGVAHAAESRGPHETVQQRNARALMAVYAQTPGCGCTGAVRAQDRTLAREARQRATALADHGAGQLLP